MVAGHRECSPGLSFGRQFSLIFISDLNKEIERTLSKHVVATDLGGLSSTGIGSPWWWSNHQSWRCLNLAKEHDLAPDSLDLDNS